MRNLIIRKFIIPAIAMASLTFAGCEAFIMARGTVYDTQTKQPLQGVYVRLIWPSRDTMFNCAYEQDTMEWVARRKLRHTGVKDDYRSFDFKTNNRAKPIPLYTDGKGKFETGKYWTSAVFGIPRVKLLLTVPGYKTVVTDRLPNNEVFMEKN